MHVYTVGLTNVFVNHTIIIIMLRLAKVLETQIERKANRAPFSRHFPT